jgi:glycosyltransferase involved in cell wall biosynthesis
MLKILCLDIEGGHGGSSNSLFQSIKYLPHERIDVEVWCKREGNIQNLYRSLGVRVSVKPNMPKLHPVPRISRNIFLFALFFLRDWPYSYSFRKQLLEKSKSVDLIHLNIDGLYWLSRWLGRRTSIPITMHKRTNPWPSIFSRLQTKIISRYITSLVFITENEESNYINLGGKLNHGTVIYNISPYIERAPTPSELIPIDDSFKICSLANYSYYRGTDRLVHIAKALQKLSSRKFLFVVAGDISLTRSLPGELGKTARIGGDLADYAEKMGVGKMFLFMGHVNNPNSVLSGCQLLIRPSRENNPWGRDVLEAYSLGLPVLATGNYNRFVEEGITGILLDEFTPYIAAKKIITLENDYKLCKRMGLKGKERVHQLCNGKERSYDLLTFWKKSISKKIQTPGT